MNASGEATSAPEWAIESDSSTDSLLDSQVDEVIAICGGDLRAALRRVLIINSELAGEIAQLTEAISMGFARGRLRKHPPSPRKRES